MLHGIHLPRTRWWRHRLGVLVTAGNLLEIELGRLALARGQSPDVKAFGLRLVTDHGKAYEELRQIAGMA